jgi:flagellin-like hook-associated protein FlgL
MSSLNGLAATLSQNVTAVQKEIVTTQSELSSGKKTLNAAEVGIVTRLSAQVSGYNNVATNVKSGLDLLSVTSTALTSMTTILSQMKDIATQAANAGLTTSDRVALNSTFGQLANQVASLMKGATVNSTNLLCTTGYLGDASVNTGDQVLQTGLTSSNTTTLASAALDTTAAMVLTGNILTQTAAATYIDTLTSALSLVSTKKSIVGAEQTGLKEQATAALSMATNLQSTVDTIENIDETALQAKLQQLNNQQSIDYYLISQMNTAASAMLTIFR